jgi:hypothetical protein
MTVPRLHMGSKAYAVVQPAAGAISSDLRCVATIGTPLQMV